jgi:sulfofructose kinase
MADVVGIGASLFDTIMVVGAYPQEDTKQRAELMLQQCGGPVATALVAAARLGAHGSYLGTLADDFFAAAMEAEFKTYGVDVSHVVKKPGSASPSSIIIVARNRASRTIVWEKGTVPAPLPSEIPEAEVRQAKVLHLDGNHRDAALSAARIARKNGVKVSLDAGSQYPGIAAVVAVTDFLVTSEEFALNFTKRTDPKAAAEAIYRQYQPEIIIVTQGKRGGFYYNGKEFKEYPAYQVAVVDTTGAGDVFHGAFVYGYLQGWDWGRITRFASAVSALKCTRPGGRTGIPSLNEVEEFIAARE